MVMGDSDHDGIPQWIQSVLSSLCQQDSSSDFITVIDFSGKLSPYFRIIIQI